MKVGSPVEAHEPMAEINITPLTDVFLVLLIIFMVTTPLIMTAGIKIKMPRTQALPSLSERDIILAITSDERYFVNNTEVPKSRLGDYLRELRIGNKLVVVQADARLTHGTVVAALDTAKAAGAERLAIATEPLPRSPARK
jgi:biopolymer transport protein ExbD